MKLQKRYVEKPWGRTELPPMFDAPLGKRIGEVWFTADRDQPLLVKYIFTSERLSIQVHPNDQQAQARHLPSGKSECWYILDAEPHAKIALGLRRTVSRDELRQSALDGTIEELMDWRPVREGDFFLVPPGTVHAIGAGISLLEFQQNADITYRLYDYGRPRELHLDDGVAVALLEPCPDFLAQHLVGNEQRTLVDGPQFILVHTNRDVLEDRLRWVIPLEGEIRANGESARPGDCMLLRKDEHVLADGWVLIGATA